MDELIRQLSQCLVRSINPASHYERELQSIVVLSALALLRTQGMTALQVDFYDLLLTQFNARFKDLWGVPDGPESFSTEVFRKGQSSYFLCLGAQ